MNNDFKLVYEETPSTYSLRSIARDIEPSDHNAFARYILVWAAFNCIYACKARTKGKEPNFSFVNGKEIKRKNVGQLRMPVVKTIPECEQINCVIDLFPDELRYELISHENIKFFVDRKPCWQGREIEKDIIGQRLNGVIKVNKMIDFNNPIWSPIDFEKYKNFKEGRINEEIINLLTHQIVDVLYTIRNNLVHGSKCTDDAWDEKVVQKALPVLELIVTTFIE